MRSNKFIICTQIYLKTEEKFSTCQRLKRLIHPRHPVTAEIRRRRREFLLKASFSVNGLIPRDNDKSGSIGLWIESSPRRSRSAPVRKVLRFRSHCGAFISINTVEVFPKTHGECTRENSTGRSTMRHPPPPTHTPLPIHAGNGLKALETVCGETEKKDRANERVYKACVSVCVVRRERGMDENGWQGLGSVQG